MNLNIGLIGIGFVGSSMLKSFKEKDIKVKAYDKFNNIYDKFNDCLNSNIIFLCLPTKFDETINQYNKESIYEVCSDLSKNNYNGLVVIKSTIETGTTEKISNKFSNLNIAHNPEFLTARTAYEDFHNQEHIVIGSALNCDSKYIDNLYNFYNYYYPKAEISICTSNESESMKLFVNCFYSVKIQFFNEIFLLTEKINNCSFDKVVSLMIKNNWINPMHTQVPGPDGKLSYGGACFPKDTNALLNLMKINNTPHNVLESTIKERNNMRNDYFNIIKK